MGRVSGTQPSTERGLLREIRNAWLDIWALVAIAAFAIYTTGDRMSDGVRLAVDFGPTVVCLGMCVSGALIIRRRIVAMHEALNRLTQR